VSWPVVTVVGSANQDMVARVGRLPGAGQTVLGHDLVVVPGGKGLNQAVAAARAAARTAFVGMIGDDGAGVHLRGVLNDEGIDIRGLAKVGALTGRALISVADDGSNHIVVVPGANWVVTADYIDRHRERIRNARVVLCQLEIPLEAVERTLSIARAGEARTLLNAAPPQLLEGDLLGLVDVLVVNEHEAGVLISGTVETVKHAEAAAKALRERGCGAVIVTLGAHGAVLVTDETCVHQPAFEVVAVDTTGCGDAFIGALAARLADGDDLPTALRWSTAAGAVAATTLGAVPSMPMEADVERLLGQAG
jgi:ribokinase